MKGVKLVIQLIQIICGKDYPFSMELPWYLSCKSIACICVGLFADSILFLIYLSIL